MSNDNRQRAEAVLNAWIKASRRTPDGKGADASLKTLVALIAQEFDAIELEAKEVDGGKDSRRKS